MKARTQTEQQGAVRPYSRSETTIVLPCKMCAKFREYDQRCRKTWTPLHNGYAMLRHSEACGGPYQDRTHPIVALLALAAAAMILPILAIKRAGEYIRERIKK